MILQAADCVEGKAPPPADLQRAWDCQQWHCLPRAGGRDQQLVKTMTRMNALLRVYNAMLAYHAEEKRLGTVSVEWMQAHPEIANLSLEIINARIKRDARI